MSSSSRRGGLLGIVALSGAASLCHQLLWTRRLVDVLGSSTSANARVLGAFFLGLSLGAALASRRVDAIARPWRALAIAELAIAVLSLPALTVPAWSPWIWQAVGVDGLVATGGGLIKLIVATAVIAPPAVAMGFTLPLALAAAGARSAEAGRVGSWLYAINTVGAVAGVVAVAGLLLATFGLTGSMWAAMGLNLAAALFAILLDRAPARAAPAFVEAPARSPQRLLPPGVLGLAFLSGAGVLAIEVVALHLLMLVATMSFYAPAVILGTMIAMLAVAAALTSVFLRSADARSAIGPVLATGGALTAAAPLIYWALVSGGALSGFSDSVGGFAGSLLGLTAAFVGPAALCVGCLFPLLMGHATRCATDAPGAVAQLLAVNGIGGLVGAEIAYQGMLPAFGPHLALGAIGLVYCIAAAAFATAAPRGPTRSWSTGYAMLCLAGTLGIAALQLPGLPTLNPHHGFDVLEQTSDRHGTLAVADHPALGRAMVVNNQYILGSTAAQFDQERQTHLPLLLHPQPRRVALIGLATGTSAGASVLHPTVSQLEVLELSRAVIDAARDHFSEANRHVVDDPRVVVLEEDGRTYIGAARERFDVIVGDLFLPWSAGVGRLYSVEHFESVHRALADGGVYCQWLPMYQLSEPQLDLVVASLRRVFPVVHLFRNGFRPDKPSLAMVALKDAELSWSVVSARASAVRAHGRVDDPSMRHAVALAMLYLGRVDGETPATEVNSLGNLALELDASRVRLSAGESRQYLQGQRWNDFLQRRLEATRTDEALGGDLGRLVRLGIELTTWDVALRIEHREVERLGERIRRSFPAVVSSDPGADWTKWPGPTGWRGRAARPVPEGPSAASHARPSGQGEVVQ